MEKSERGRTVAVMPRKKGVGDGGSAAQKHTHGTLPDSVHATKKSSTPVASGTTAMMMTHTGNASNLQCQEVGRRKGAKEVLVMWAYSVALVWFVLICE